MYVTKRNMANAVSSMTKHLEQVQSSLAVSTYFFPNLSQELCHQLHNVATMTPSLLFSKIYNHGRILTLVTSVFLK
jgi:hypothetical protein